jgi:hypothetical protein
MKPQSGIPYNRPTTRPTLSLKNGSTTIDVYEHMHEVEVYQITDEKVQRITMTHMQMIGFTNMMKSAGFV